MDAATPDAAEVAETHSAWVFMVGDRAYKLKKPVNLGFLDFSTRAAREAILHREVVLNRRLAPDVYLGVADVIGPDGELCDHLLVMRRMPADRRLTKLVRDGAPLDTEMHAIARVIAGFHAAGVTSAEIASAGSPAALRAKLDQDLEQIRPFSGAPLDPGALDAVATLGHRYLDGRGPLFEGRRGAGLMRDGHGDLLADDIFCLEDGPRILDCIEFDDHLRHGDVLADVAFLVMDLERLGAPQLGERLMASYQEFGAERHPASLVDYYVACRALIRSKVACIRAFQGIAAAGEEATTLLGLALDHLRRARVRLVVVGGLPGTGKSTLAAGLAERTGWLVLRSDEVRKDLAGVSHSARAGGRLGAGIYDEASTEATYHELLARAQAALEMGESVVVDASWSRASWRSAAVRVADDSASDLVELRCEAPAAVAAPRIETRQALGADASDATAEIAATMSARFEAWPSARSISTAGTVEQSLEAALDVVDAV
jgi:aminoglycoside phosphotransferase family enzyme/predicted kinase